MDSFPNSTHSLPLLVTAGLIRARGKYLLAQRPPGSWMEGFWEFPGGKVEAAEDPRAGLAREIREELGVEVTVGEIEEVLFHRYPDRAVLLLFFHCELASGEPHGREGQALRWCSVEEMRTLPLLPADMPLVPRLERLTETASAARG
ncbi:MAG: (deoxy)nucleoside triphosphate pyrophosphohydrolase [Candidatus Omnitrophica bacterium]|nr:CTP pyrophosphohydrolase [bacterium]NUN97542.1 (deoxy)nucleoside triphosphate pyrophosphohydrolase [Candidatus Omnitrophota bacterium]